MLLRREQHLRRWHLQAVWCLATSDVSPRIESLRTFAPEVEYTELYDYLLNREEAFCHHFALLATFLFSFAARSHSTFQPARCE